MKILLIIPPCADYLADPSQQTSLGILYVSSFLKKEGHLVLLADLSSYTLAEAISFLQSTEFWSTYLRGYPDIIGFTVTTLDYENCVFITQKLKTMVPTSTRFVIGGPHPSLAQIDTLKRVDSSVFNNLFYGEIEGKRYNIDEIPFPDRDAVPNNGISSSSIFAGGEHYKGTKSATIITSRGCPHSCAFCASGNSGFRGFRMRSADNICKELIEIIERYGVYQFRIQDDNVALSKTRFKQMMGKFKDLEVAWRASARIDSIDEEVIRDAVRGGCKEIGYGIESADIRVIELMKKNLDIKKAKEVIKMTKANGIKVRLFFMVSVPGETEVTIDKNIEFIEEMSPDLVTCASFVPFPGTPIWNNPDEYGIEILDRDFTNYRMALYEEDYPPVVKIDGLSMEVLYSNRRKMRDFLFGCGLHNKGV